MNSIPVHIYNFLGKGLADYLKLSAITHHQRIIVFFEQDSLR